MNCAHKTKELGDEGAGDIFMTMYGEKILEQDTKCIKYIKKKPIPLNTLKLKLLLKLTIEKGKEKPKRSHRQENIFAVHITNNTLVPRIYKELQHFSLESNSAIFDKVEDIHIQNLAIPL